ncbi:type II toxin-antitoxin system death-on-curing family toxin [Alkalicella caledoniensis]|uniref:Type II toxin-antitoxin system death-on-curing family toxin n=1 Tax=Alkalicella caledoniensis TaxID=2731377 RepID=A0A7G9W5X9_ALKCA|nr:type II toxin-antitoxin system death-on-curing family toxin [Alkalicella caledoniensis]QNO14091.1 type II toxin-antitoxin system death-on-curing family toxin [Alkalicella caledoniensis]
MDSYSYITIEEAIVIHRKTVENSGGGTTLSIDNGKLESVLCNIQNDDYYPTFVDKVTHLFFCVCKFHCFADGNKRIAITLSTQFLLKNGYMLIARDFIVKMENISYHVAAGNINKVLLHKIMTSIFNGEYDIDEEIKLEIYNAIKDRER